MRTILEKSFRYKFPILLEMYTILVFLSFFKFSTCALIIIWGEPSQWVNCSLSIALDWETCIEECESNEMWIFAYFDLNNDCYLCGPEQIYSIEDGRSVETTKVAFKVDTSTCDELSNEYSTSDYSVMFNNGFWNFTYTADSEAGTMTTSMPTPTIHYYEFRCPDGWAFSTREMGYYCIRLYSGTMNRTDALSYCEAQGAVLSGVENLGEQQFIINEGVKIARSATNVNPGVGALWVGAERYSACSGSSMNAVGCVPWSQNAYRWTDGFTTLKNMMTWLPDQPDYVDENENCVQMAIINITGLSAGTVSGDLNDCVCDMTTSTNGVTYIIGFVCGQQASYSTKYY